MTRAVLRRHTGLLCLVTAVALTGACDSGETAKSPSTSPSSASRPTARQDAVITYGEPAKEILDRAFVGREEISSGYGRLGKRFGDTAPAAPANVLSAAFAFTCTGGGKVTLGLTVAGKDVPMTTRTVTCDKSIFQQSVEIPEPGTMGFEADATGSGDGVFAYSYYVESKQLP
ncbi:hypothetical protein ABZX85_42010 [Streptomyces sp. NPDC004539]|uniref:hypothetical protein n=1 Tax=Streptomyces sp. NPDC004539 TaxID=3154280 RepID=UPI0033B851AD